MVEILRKAAQAQAQGLRCKMQAADITADKEPRHPHNPVQTRPPGVRVPAESNGPGTKGRGRAGKHEAAEPAVSGSDQVAKLATAVLHRALGMLVPEQARKDLRFFAPGNRAHLKTRNGVDTVRNATGSGHGIRKHPGTRGNPRAPPRRRKPDAPRRLKVAERRPAARLARIAERVDKTEPRADLPRECRPARKALGRRQGRENRLTVGGKQHAANRCIRSHEATIAARSNRV